MSRRPVSAAPPTPLWVWIALVLVVGAIAAVAYWAFYLPLRAAG